MCICINCRHIHRCKIYEFIEKQHCKNKMLQKNNYFIPVDTIIVVHINKQNVSISLDWDLQECSSFVEEPGYWLLFS
uniref:Ycf34 n=1 Tax=Dipterosiphonia australica TaxID=2007208 RepID=A0A1Z1MLS0_9FLOR|nr:hypothetical protein [Dipterosiphonia australica]ARW66802.1 hypothetical protein [Dipterosiphonia australica]